MFYIIKLMFLWRNLFYFLQYHEELLRLVSMDMRTTLYPHLVAQAERWMMFAINKCEKGRGRRPK